MFASFSTDKFKDLIETAALIRAGGRIQKIVGMVIEASGPASQIGCVCDIHAEGRAGSVSAEVLGFRENSVLLMPLEDIRSLGPGCKVVARKEKAQVGVGKAMLGRIIDGLGNPIDGKGPIPIDDRYPVYANPMNPLLRNRISKPLDLGVRAINGLLTIGCGQRMGIFAGSGVGKSVLLGMIARRTSAEVNVIALIGERGRELNEFIQKDLGEEGLKRSVVVVATSDHLPLVRLRGGFIATAIAEYFRDQGAHVNLMMDSVTRLAWHNAKSGFPWVSRRQPKAIRLPYLPCYRSCLNVQEHRPGVEPSPASIRF